MLLMLFCLFVYSFPPFSLFFDNIAIFIMGKNRPDCMKCDKNTVRRKGMICPTCLPKANKAELKLHESKKAEESAKAYAYNVKFRKDNLGNGLCQTGCKKPVVPGTLRCAEHTVKHKEDTRSAYSTTLVQQKAAGLCIEHACSSHPEEGLARCAYHAEMHRISGKIIATLDDQKENIKPCNRRGCNFARYADYVYCKKHYEEDNKRKRENGLDWRSRETSQEKLANQRQRQKENKTGIGRMSISFFNAFDLKHNYLVRKLNGYSLPTDSDLYMDTEVVDINHGHKAYNVYEWTILTYNRKGEQVWFQRKAKKAFVPKETLIQWAIDIAEFVNGELIVQYGSSKPEEHRLAKLLEYLPSHIEQPEYEFYEPSGGLFKSIFSRDADDELQTTARVYAPDWSLTAIARRFNRVYNDDLSKYKLYEPSWDWDKWGGWKESGLLGKSVLDVVYLHSLIKALRHLQDDEYFHTSYGFNPMHNLQSLENINGTQMGEISVGEVEQEELINEELELGGFESDENSDEESVETDEHDKGEGSSKRSRFY